MQLRRKKSACAITGARAQHIKQCRRGKHTARGCVGVAREVPCCLLARLRVGPGEGVPLALERALGGLPYIGRVAFGLLDANVAAEVRLARYRARCVVCEGVYV